MGQDEGTREFLDRWRFEPCDMEDAPVTPFYDEPDADNGPEVSYPADPGAREFLERWHFGPEDVEAEVAAARCSTGKKKTRPRAHLNCLYPHAHLSLVDGISDAGATYGTSEFWEDGATGVPGTDEELILSDNDTYVARPCFCSGEIREWGMQMRRRARNPLSKRP